MPAVSGDRFSSQNLSDCLFCPSGGRKFRTARQCGGCGRPLCLVCRPAVPGQAYLCPDCGGGPVENAVVEAARCVARISTAGHVVPFWLETMCERAAGREASQAEEIIVPE